MRQGAVKTAQKFPDNICENRFPCHCILETIRKFTVFLIFFLKEFTTFFMSFIANC